MSRTVLCGPCTARSVARCIAGPTSIWGAWWHHHAVQSLGVDTDRTLGVVLILWIDAEVCNKLSLPSAPQPLRLLRANSLACRNRGMQPRLEQSSSDSALLAAGRATSATQSAWQGGRSAQAQRLARRQPFTACRALIRLPIQGRLPHGASASSQRGGGRLFAAGRGLALSVAEPAADAVQP